MRRHKLNRLRGAIEVSSVSLDDATAAGVPELFPVWKEDIDLAVGDRVQYEGILYKVLIAHKTQASWTPDVSPSLFAVVLIPDPGDIPEWVQPGSTNPYMKGDKVRHNDKVWVSDIDNNVWEPGVYGWSEA
jgi:hypothetical protein